MSQIKFLMKNLHRLDLNSRKQAEMSDDDWGTVSILRFLMQFFCCKYILDQVSNSSEKLCIFSLQPSQHQEQADRRTTSTGVHQAKPSRAMTMIGAHHHPAKEKAATTIGAHRKREMTIGEHLIRTTMIAGEVELQLVAEVNSLILLYSDWT